MRPTGVSCFVGEASVARPRSESLLTSEGGDCGGILRTGDSCFLGEAGEVRPRGESLAADEVGGD
jgi:hypothetical protein